MNKNINEIKNIFEEHFNEILDKIYKKSSYNKTLIEAMKYATSNSGKRIRPILLLLLYKAFNGKIDKTALNFASIIEIIHTYSLIHDDLPAMDDDTVRRGKPTVHVVFGEAIAILAGDALLNLSFEVFLDELRNETNSLEKLNFKIKAGEVIFSKAGYSGMIGGQSADIEAENKVINEECLDYIHEHKTGDLIYASILVPGILSNISENEINILKDFSAKLGLSYQIKDDLLDVQENENLLLKSNSDIENNKNTYVKMYGESVCEEKFKFLSEMALNDLEKLSNKFNVDDVIEIYKFLIVRRY